MNPATFTRTAAAMVAENDARAGSVRGMKGQLPTSMHVQCPGCGVPTVATELRQTPTGGYGLLLDPCGHLVTLELIRDSWGIDIPDPDPTRVEYPQT